MKKRKIKVVVESNGTILDGFTYNFLDVQNAVAFNKLIMQLTLYISALLESVLNESAGIRVGHLVATLRCGDFCSKVLDICGVIPVDNAGISEMLMENNISEKVKNIILDYILSVKA